MELSAGISPGAWVPLRIPSSSREGSCLRRGRRSGFGLCSPAAERGVALEFSAVVPSSPGVCAHSERSACSPEEEARASGRLLGKKYAGWGEDGSGTWAEDVETFTGARCTGGREAGQGHPGAAPPLPHRLATPRPASRAQVPVTDRDPHPLGASHWTQGRVERAAELFSWQSG